MDTNLITAGALSEAILIAVDYQWPSGTRRGTWDWLAAAAANNTRAGAG